MLRINTPDETRLVGSSPAHGLLDVVRDIALSRAALLDDLRAALLRGDEAAALEVARVFCGLRPERKH